MQHNKISIVINKPISLVFDFTINPDNTHLWIDSVKEEQTNEWPVRIGTIYKNCDNHDVWSTYTLVGLEENKIFELASLDGIYHVRYTYRIIDADSCELEYYEWMDEGELATPFSMHHLEALKNLLEQ